MWSDFTLFLLKLYHTYPFRTIQVDKSAKKGCDNAHPNLLPSPFIFPAKYKKMNCQKKDQYNRIHTMTSLDHRKFFKNHAKQSGKKREKEDCQQAPALPIHSLPVNCGMNDTQQKKYG